MESLIPIINKLQNVFNTVGTDALLLPQIAVVGTQSSGKSSVLENLVGRSFLPRGIGIVTRRPLILQLINIPNGEKVNCEEYGVFLHKKNAVFQNFEEIRMEIETETNNKAGGNKGISEEPISLKIYSKKVVNLTLIDLPGLTKVPIGDQPQDIEARIRKLVLKYICNPNAIILAVITANTDMTTSESLQMARECDPQGIRTVAVVTKLDLMDSGTDALDILSGKVIPVRLGIIGVVNRSQKDTKENKLISESIEDEAAFLQKHYPNIASRNGTPYLAKTLNRILMNHIKECLPDLKARISAAKGKTMMTLGLFGDDVTDSSKTMLQVITKFCTTYCSALDGTSRQIETSELSGGARICYIFHEIFGKTLESIQPLLGLTKLDILTAMRNASGTRPALFVPEVCFEVLVKKQIGRLLEPSLRCVELIHEEMQHIVQQSGNELQQEVLRFPKLFEKLAAIASEVIRRRLPDTNVLVEHLINIELAYINTMHPEFRKDADINTLFQGEKPQSDRSKEHGNERTLSPMNFPRSTSSTIDQNEMYQTAVVPSGWFASFIPEIPENRENLITFRYPNENRIKPDIIAIKDSVQTLGGGRFTDRDNRECKVIEKLIINYFGIVRKSIQDSVPKAIMYCLVNFVKENLQRELVELLYKSEQDEDLLQEPEHIKLRREEQKSLLRALEDADIILNEIRDILL